MEKIKVWQGDITTLEAEAIVNAANHSLLGGGGVDGAIHRAAGPQLKEECKTLNGAETGEAKLTKGYQLPADYVIHTVGPAYKDGNQGEPEQLAACYRNSLKVAADHEIKTIAFPAISTGIYQYPALEAAQIAVKTINESLNSYPTIEQVILVAFDAHTKQRYETELAAIKANNKYHS
ncbi:O-acetyl-ADP-ribose deacetylase [Marinilactibacillus piezotolerans]|uniref:O-acetyl-ADP-ribose deacetylase n=1 Tax=Marinilactibacillus piezotolerans TaxID=258723 RepID=UPI0009B13643|nr:O-acetyl-ADP-ribose deacetylase [Marinilactibacillus piezotolerans]